MTNFIIAVMALAVPLIFIGVVIGLAIAADLFERVNRRPK